MANPHGTPIWYELISADPGASKAFYDAVLGWTVEGAPSGELDYRMIDAGRGLVGGVMRLTDEMAARGAAPGWLMYVGVDDVDRTVDAIAGAGGRVLMPARTMPGVGRFALVADPQGAPFYAMRGASDATSTAFDPTGVGKCSWNELSAPDQDGALDFYAHIFGWSFAERMPIGEFGDYVFADCDGVRIGAVMRQPPAGPPPGWRFYFRVGDVDAAAERVAAGGGVVHHGPMDVPNGDRIIIATDPHGVMFGAVGTARGS